MDSTVIVPQYTILIVIVTALFMAVSLSAIATYGIISADLPLGQRKRFAARLAAYMFVWVVLVLAISYTNVVVPKVEQTFPLLGVLILGATVLGGVLLYRSPTAMAALDTIPIAWLASIQIYRIIGIVFLFLQADGLLPAYFASTTGWGDIFVGVTAPIVGYLLWKNARRFRYLGQLWCAIGIGDLFLVLYKAVNSAPGPLQTTAFDLPTVIIGYFPLSIVPLLVVPISLILHALLVLRLTRQA